MARLFTCEFGLPSEGKFQMAMTTAATGDHPVGVLPPFETALLQWLTSLSETWQPMDVLVLSQTDSVALHCCVQTGLVELQIPARAWTSDVHRPIRVTFYVTGGWQPRDLTELLRTHVPDWSSQRVSIQQDAQQFARLTRPGQDAQHDITQAGSLLQLTALQVAQANRQPPRVRCRIDDFGPPQQHVAAAQATATVGDIVIHHHTDLGAQAPQECAATRASAWRRPVDDSQPAKTKTARIGRWLAQYLHDQQQAYDCLIPQVGVDRHAQRRFRELFGPTTLARLFTCADGADGDGKQERSNKTAIQNSAIYRARIQPVLQGQPPVSERDLRRQQCDDDLRKAGL